jgi:heterodisulfide reductase subunit C
MAEDVLLIKSGFGLLPSDMMSGEFIATLSEGEVVECTIKRPRNVRHLRMFMALRDEVFKAQTFYATKEEVLLVIKDGIGYTRKVVKRNGDIITEPMSIAFNKMDQTAFNQFFDKALELICTEILPRMNKVDLEKRVYEILGGPGPDSYNR